MPIPNGALELRQRIMASKNDREDCQKRLQALIALERDLREQLIRTCSHETLIGIHGEASFDFTAGGSCVVRQLTAPQRLCCFCGHLETGTFTPEVETRLRQELLATIMHPAELLDRAAQFANLVGTPVKRIFRDVFEEFVRRHDLNDPIICGPVLLAYAPTLPMEIKLEPP